MAKHRAWRRATAQSPHFGSIIVSHNPIADSRNSLEICDVAERNHEQAAARQKIRTAFATGPRKPLSGA
jgi:hypothetical protein